MLRSRNASLIRPMGFAALLSAVLLITVSCTPGGTWGSQAQVSPAVPVASAACQDGVQTSGARYRICMPNILSFWNGDLLVYAHGYVPSFAPVAIPEDQLRLPDGTSIPDQVTFLGYAFATTSYSVNGLAVKEALVDLADLASIFRSQYPQVQHVYLVGVSEGGLITTLGVEQPAQVYQGGIATCGPIGDFQKQANYFGDFRVIFDYFFPGLMPGSPVNIPQDLMDNWDTHFQNTIDRPVKPIHIPP